MKGAQTIAESKVAIDVWMSLPPGHAQGCSLMTYNPNESCPNVQFDAWLAGRFGGILGALYSTSTPAYSVATRNLEG